MSQALLGTIHAGELAAGEALPTEEALCARFGVSRITVRRALDELAGRNLIVRRQGVGTFVATPATTARSVTLTGTIDDLLSPNRLVVVRDVHVVPPADVLDFAGLPPGTRLRLFEGTNHLAGGEPLVHLRYYYPQPFAARLTAAMLCGPTPPIKVLEQRFGVVVDHAEQRVEAQACRGRTARRLRLRSGTPVLRAIRVYYDDAMRVVELFDAVYHPVHYRYTARLYPKPQLRTSRSAVPAAGRRRPSRHPQEHPA